MKHRAFPQRCCCYYYSKKKKTNTERRDTMEQNDFRFVSSVINEWENIIGTPEFRPQRSHV